jgi:hypothetical protein
MTFIAVFSLTFKIGQLQHPFNQLGKSDAVYARFCEIIPESLVEFHRNIFVVIPEYRWFVHGFLFEKIT